MPIPAGYSSPSWVCRMSVTSSRTTLFAEDSHAVAAKMSPMVATRIRTRQACSTGPEEVQVASAQMSVTVVDHPLAHDLLAQLRDEGTPPPRFRTLTRRLGGLLVIE